MSEWQSIVATGVTQNSYGSFRRSGRKPAQAMAQHFVDSADTLQGISLKYNVNMEDLRRINKLHYTDSIQSRQFLNIPILKDSDMAKTIPAPSNKPDKIPDRNCNGAVHGTDKKVEKSSGAGRESESTVHDFLRKLDMQISSTKQIASTMLSENDYKLPNSGQASTARYMEKGEFEDSVRTAFSNSNSYHNSTDEHFKL